MPGVLEGRARPCSVPISISFIANVIRQICQLARMRKRKISVLKNQSRNLSKKSKIIEFLIKVFWNVLSLWQHAGSCRGNATGVIVAGVGMSNYEVRTVGIISHFFGDKDGGSQSPS